MAYVIDSGDFSGLTLGEVRKILETLRKDKKEKDPKHLAKLIEKHRDERAKEEAAAKEKAEAEAKTKAAAETPAESKAEPPDEDE